MSSKTITRPEIWNRHGSTPVVDRPMVLGRYGRTRGVYTCSSTKDSSSHTPRRVYDGRPSEVPILETTQTLEGERTTTVQGLRGREQVSSRCRREDTTTPPTLVVWLVFGDGCGPVMVHGCIDSGECLRLTLTAFVENDKSVKESWSVQGQLTGSLVFNG